MRKRKRRVWRVVEPALGEPLWPLFAPKGKLLIEGKHIMEVGYDTWGFSFLAAPALQWGNFRLQEVKSCPKRERPWRR